MKTAAVVVAWHEPGLTANGLTSLMAMSVRPDISICIAQEFTAEEREEYEARVPPGVMTMFVNENLGFAQGVNTAMDLAIAQGADWALVLNNDATADRDCLEALIQAGCHDRVAVVSPAIRFMDSPDRLWYGGGRLSPHLTYTRHRGLHETVDRVPATSDTEYVPACCALYSTVAWRDVGPFNADYFMYFEDADWSVRARSRGWTLRYVGQVLASHAVGVSSGQRGSTGLSPNPAYYLARNPLRFALDAKPGLLKASRLAGYALVWTPYNVLRLARSRRWAVARAYCQGVRDGLRGEMGERTP